MADEINIEINGNAKGFVNATKKAGGAARDIQADLTKVAAGSAVAFAGLVATIGLATKQFLNFNKGFTSVQTLLDKTSFSSGKFSDNIDNLRKGVLDLSVVSGDSFDSLNKSLFDIVSAGVPAEKALATLESATRLATAGATDTATAVKAITASLTSFGDAAGSAEVIAQKFFTAQKFGVTTVGELAREFNKVGGLAKTLGVSFDQTLAAATALTADGAKPTAQAFTSMRAAMSGVIIAQGKLKGQSPEVQQALSLQNVQQKGLVEALQETFKALDGNIPALQKLVGSTEAVTVVTSLAGGQAGLYAKILKELADETKRTEAFNTAFNVKQQDLNKTLDQAGQSVKVLAVTFAAEFAPTIKSIANSIKGFAVQLANLSPATRSAIATAFKFATVFTGIVAILATVKLALFAAAAAGLVLLSPVVLIIAGVAALVAGFVVFRETIIDTGKHVIRTVAGWIGQFEKFQSLANKVIGFFKSGTSFEVKGLKETEERLKGLTEERQKLLDIEKESGIGPEDKERLRSLDDEIQKTKNLAEGRTKFLDKRLVELKKERDELDKLQKARNINTEERASNKERLSAISKEITAINSANPTRGSKDGNTGEIETARSIAAEKGAAELAEEEKTNTARILKTKERIQRRLDLEKEFKAQGKEVEAAEFEEELIKREEQQAILGEQKDRFREEDDGKKKKASDKKVTDEKKERAILLSADAEYNKGRSLNARETAGLLTDLQRSGNKEAKTLGKAAAITQIGIDSAAAAIAVFASLSRIPVIGFALGVAAAAGIAIRAKEQVSAVNKAQGGGIVPNVPGGGSRDRVPILAEPDEVIIPKNIVPNFIQQFGRGGDQGGGDGQSPKAEVVLSFQEDAASYISARQREDEKLSIGIT